MGHIVRQKRGKAKVCRGGRNRYKVEKPSRLVWTGMLYRGGLVGTVATDEEETLCVLWQMYERRRSNK